jgi:hypothetical protein
LLDFDSQFQSILWIADTNYKYYPDSITATPPASLPDSVHANWPLFIGRTVIHQGPHAITYRAVRAGSNLASTVIVKEFDIQPDSASQLLRAEQNAILHVQERCGLDITPSVIGIYFLEDFDAGVMIMQDGGDSLFEKRSFNNLCENER